MTSLLSWRDKALDHATGLGLLALRLWAGQEFVQAGLTKLSGGVHAPDWFAMLSFPAVVAWMPVDVNWVVAGLGEITLGSALIAGLFSRFASMGLMFITYVAVYTVHFDLGWAGWDQIETEAGQGYKLPLMLAIMLFALLTQGPGQYALDPAVRAWRMKRRAP